MKQKNKFTQMVPTQSNMSELSKQAIRIGLSLLLLLTSINATIVMAAGSTISLEFTSLPSAQGWSYTGAPETSVFSLNNGILHQDTINVVGSLGFYRLSDVVDPNLPFVLYVRAAALAQQGGLDGSDSFIFGVDTGTELFAVALSPNRIEDAFGNALSTTVDNTSFHDYRLEGTPGVGYQLYRDNILVGTGLPRGIPGPGVNSLFFGDATNGPDAIGEISSYSFVQNQAPIADANGAYAVDEGDAILLDGSNSFDPDLGDTLTYEWDLDYDGVNFDSDISGATPSFDATSLDGFSSRTVALRVTDNAGASNIDTATVTINNVAPTAIFSSTSAMLIEGETTTLLFSTQFDPGLADAIFGFVYSYDCSNDGTFDAAGVSADSFDCQYLTSGNFIAKGRIEDKDGGFTDYAVAITVLTPTEATEEVILAVEDLVDSAILNQGQGNSLVNKLDGAITKLEDGNINAAINMLQSLINQVNNLIGDGILTPAEGQSLIDAANAIIDAVNG